MVIRVLIVDDSRFICKLIKRVLDEEADFLVVGFAHNGQEAIDKVAEVAPDVITMDVEMPIMNGIEAVRRIMAKTPIPILMFSSMTKIGARATLEALSAGAVDFLAKELEEIDGDFVRAKRTLRHRVRLVAATSRTVLRQISIQAAAVAAQPALSAQLAMQLKLAVNQKVMSQGSTLTVNSNMRPNVPRYHHVIEVESRLPIVMPVLKRIRLLVVVASTGGPLAIQSILTHLPSTCPVPILIVQHMPANFTSSFAERLNSLCAIQVKEAQLGDLLTAGVALLAPGGQQMEIAALAGQYRVNLRPKSTAEIYGPSANVTLTSIAQQFMGQVLSVTLTGMGSDGKDGVVKLKQAGAMIWAQNEESCTIYGMPKAIIEAKLADNIFSLDEMANAFATLS